MHNPLADSSMQREENRMSDQDLKTPPAKFFDAESFLAAYAGDISLTPDGLRYLGVLPRPHRYFATQFPFPDPSVVAPKRRAV